MGGAGNMLQGWVRVWHVYFPHLFSCLSTAALLVADLDSSRVVFSGFKLLPGSRLMGGKISYFSITLPTLFLFPCIWGINLVLTVTMTNSFSSYWGYKTWQVYRDPIDTHHRGNH